MRRQKTEQHCGNRAPAQPNPHTPYRGLRVSGLRYYSPELGRCSSRSPGVVNGNLYTAHDGDYGFSIETIYFADDVDRLSEKGKSGCNYSDGTMWTKVESEICNSGCVQKHENVHVDQRASCCAKVSTLCTQNPTQCITYKNLYKEWRKNTSDSAECSAYSVMAACYLAAAESAGSSGDCKCAKELSAAHLFAMVEVDKRCSIDGSFNIMTTPCPLDKF